MISPKSNFDAGMSVLVMAPTGRDSFLICDLLQKISIHSTPVQDFHAAWIRMPDAGALVLAEEALTPELVESFSRVLKEQPAWSDLPLILLTTSGEVTIQSLQRRTLRAPLGNVLLLERPIRPETLISTIKSALRARSRQYQLRDQLQQYRQAEEALRKAEKLAVAGRLAASVAHEINNPLEAVTNLLYLMRTTPHDPPMDEYLVLAEQELARVTEIAKQTLKFYREPSPHGPTNVAEVLESVLLLYRPRIAARNVTVQKELPPTASIPAGAGELRQLFSNLIGNALDSMRSGGQLRIRAREGQDHAGGQRAGIRISVADTGTGIPVELRAKVFEPFVTTKTDDTGTGLGLWVTSEIVQKHGGKIRVRSSVDQQHSGTTFSVFLPYQNTPAA